MTQAAPAIHSAPMVNTLRRHREKRRLTLKKLSALTGVAEAQLSRIEREVVEPRGITQERIADALGVPRDVLFPEPQEAAV